MFADVLQVVYIHVLQVVYIHILQVLCIHVLQVVYIHILKVVCIHVLQVVYDEDLDEDKDSVYSRLPDSLAGFQKSLTVGQGCLLLLVLREHLKVSLLTYPVTSFLTQ